MVKSPKVRHFFYIRVCFMKVKSPKSCHFSPPLYYN